MKRLAAALAIAVAVLGWSLFEGPLQLPLFQGPVQVLTGPAGFPSVGGCFTNSASGPLIVDPKYGTAITDSDVHSSCGVTVAWRPGFTARRIGSALRR